jgi:hypothetical protein
LPFRQERDHLIRMRFSQRTLLTYVGAALLALTALAGCGGTTGPTFINGTPQAHAVIHDALTSNPDGWTVASGHCFFKSDGYHFTDGTICYSPAGNEGDSITTVTVKQISGDNGNFAGIVFHRVSKGNYYDFIIDTKRKWEFDVIQNDQVTPLVPYVPNSAIMPGVNNENTLTVVAIGTTYTFSINGVQVGQYTDATFARGLCGLVGGSNNAEDVFTNFTLSEF